MKCNKCGKEIGTGKKVDNHDGWKIVGGIAAFAAFSNPLICGAGLCTAGKKAWDRYVKGDYKVKCPHCGTTINVTKDEYMEMTGKN